MKRLYKITHFALMFMSVASLADPGRNGAGNGWESAFRPAHSTEDAREADKRFAELAREDRKRREETYREALKRCQELEREAEQRRREMLRVRF